MQSSFTCYRVYGLCASEELLHWFSIGENRDIQKVTCLRGLRVCEGRVNDGWPVLFNCCTNRKHLGQGGLEIWCDERTRAHRSPWWHHSLQPARIQNDSDTDWSYGSFLASRLKCWSKLWFQQPWALSNCAALEVLNSVFLTKSTSSVAGRIKECSATRQVELTISAVASDGGASWVTLAVLLAAAILDQAATACTSWIKRVRNATDHGYIIYSQQYQATLSNLSDVDRSN